MRLQQFQLRDLALIWEDLRSNFFEYREWMRLKRADRNFPSYIRYAFRSYSNYKELLSSKYINQLKVGGLVA